MAKPQSIETLIEDAYAAALDPSRWAAWTEDAIASLEGRGGTFSVLNSRSRLHEHFHLAGPYDDFRDEYLRDWARYDPQLPAAFGVTRPACLLDIGTVDLTDPATAEFMAWQKSEGGFEHWAISVVPLGDEGMMGALSVHSGLDHGVTSPAVRRKLQTLLPHFTRALRLGFEHSAMLQEAWWEGRAAASGNAPLLLLDERGRVRRASEAALALCGSALQLASSRLSAGQGADDASLQSLIAKAIDPAQAAAGAVRLSNGKGGFLIVIAFPLARSRRALAPFEAAALVRIVDPVRRKASGVDMWQAAFGLTKREAALAGKLAEGHSVESAAAVLAMSGATARVHLRRIFAKTSTTRQSELIALLTRIV